MVTTRQQQTKVRTKARGGNGEVDMQFLVNGAEGLYGKGSLFAHITLEPGCSVGEHPHQGDNEIYYLLTGSGEYNDNGTIVAVHAGDVCVCNSGEMHGLVNTGSETMEMIALVVNS